MGEGERAVVGVDESGQRVVEPADVQLDVGSHLGHAFTAERSGIHGVARPRLGEPVEGVEPVNRALGVQPCEMVDGAS